MRARLAALLAATAFVSSPTFAADYLRGTQSPALPPPPVIQDAAPTWDGFYIGGFGGYSSVGFDPGRGPRDIVARVLRQTTVEVQHNASSLLQPQRYSVRGFSYGGFLGYNWAFGEAVVGLEADYQRFGKGGSSTDTIARQFAPNGNFVESVDLSGTNNARLNDLFSIRGRLGYAMGTFMPYVTGGVAFGYGSVSNSASIIVQGRALDPATPPSALPYLANYGTVSERRTNSLMTGFTVGAGAEAMLGALILRGEYLYTRVQAQGGVVIDVNQARVGAGVKF